MSNPPPTRKCLVGKTLRRRHTMSASRVRKTTDSRLTALEDGLGRMEALLGRLVEGKVTATVTPTVEPVTEAEVVVTSLGDEINTPEAKKSVNHALADLLREHKVVPQGQAWAAAKAGSRAWKTLQALNAEDDLDFAKYAEVGEKIRAGIAARVDGSAKAKTTTKSPKKVAAGKAAAKGRARDEKGRLLPKDATPAPEAASSASKVETLIAHGFTRDEALAHVAATLV